jgi:AraC-like DNA-binding protein
MLLHHQSSMVGEPVMGQIEKGKPRGLLDWRTGETRFRLTRYVPSNDMAYFVQRYWIVEWDLRGMPAHSQETLTHPCVNLVFERGKSVLVGVETGIATDVLQGQDFVFGIKFKPGAFYPFLNASASTITNTKLKPEAIFGLDIIPLEDLVLSAPDVDAMIAHVEAFFRPRLPAHDETVTLVTEIVDWIMSEPSITRVEDVAQHFHFTVRSLQRLFSQYVGVSPKWVIKRYRLHEAALQLEAGQDINCTRLVYDLGYFDQAHFIKDFKTIIGRTPAEYARNQLQGTVYTPPPMRQ